jgi:alkylation response protein AidB-like acyl-CoA dehydrogenase
MASKQAGITFLLMDMKAKGVTVRPINQIQGDQEFCEMFLDDVEVPVEDRVGEEDKGWAVAQATLSSERGLTLMELSYRMRGALARVAELIRKNGREQTRACCAISASWQPGRYRLRHCRPVPAEPHRRDRRPGRCLDRQEHLFSRVLREYSLLGLRLGGMAEQYRAPITFGDLNTGNWMADFMNSYAWTIAGGSEEVQRNIIAERMLEMPREPKHWTL